MTNNKAIGVSQRGDSSTLISKNVSIPTFPTGHDILVEILGFDGAGVVSEVGPSASNLFKPGDEVFYSGSTIRQGNNAEYQFVDARSVGHKPANLSFAEAAALPLTYITAYEALIERLGIREGENASILIVNGAGGVGAAACQVAKHVLKLPVVIATAGRPETQQFSRDMGATHIVNHREDIASQVKGLGLDLSYSGPHPLKYIFITHSTTPYLHPAAQLCVPFGKVCTIVQSKEMDKLYGTEFMAKSLTFVWALLGTKPYYGVDIESHGRILEELRDLVENGSIRSHLKMTLPLTLKGLKEGHEIVEGGGSIGKVVCDIDSVGEGEEAFA
ncbi:NAD(P)-binding protein [Rhizodiscina lignyota]|uniref:NAD(P)-binding protein n=1 Tax=Rhizodiscina lignyota TaxID=1504668 RepID=A0A9P4IT83_9PEZI|nr:NAD(P)-binding protein [Rhizodiscina lignyota]